jgi:hypothetical protein
MQQRRKNSEKTEGPMKIVVITVTALALLGGGSLWVMRAVDAKRPQGTDEDQLRRLVYIGETAAEQHNSVSINRLISEDYRDSLGMSDTSLKYQIREYLSQRRAIDVVIPSERVVVYIAPDGKTGTITFPMTVMNPQTAPAPGSPGNPQFPAAASTGGDMTLTLGVRKERVHYFYVFPGEEWKVTSAEGYSTGAFE